LFAERIAAQGIPTDEFRGVIRMIHLLINNSGSGAGWGLGSAAPGLFLADTAGGFDLWATFLRAEIFGKIIVVLLCCFSLLAWTVMLSKYLDLSRWRQLNLAFQSRLRQTQTLLSQTVSANLRGGGPYARLFHDAFETARQYRADGDAKVRMGLIENALQRGVGIECMRYEAKMTLLGSMVSGAPFIGLLGTVAGVMVAFNGMSAPGSGSTLQNIAPGVASALLATVCGLLVAIPSMFGYNILLTQVKVMITELENYASWLADRLELEIEAEKSRAAPVPEPAPIPLHQPPPAPAAPPADPAVTAAERYLRLDVSEESGEND
jgi:biopolymer transport protein TolQ